MITVRQIERLWKDQSYQAMLGELTGVRPEGRVASVAGELASEPVRSLSAAAMGVVRLDELNQSHCPLYAHLLNRILQAQQDDGGWAGDLMATALCVRALCSYRGKIPAIDRGIKYLADLQQPAGIWPCVPIRRMPSDAAVSAYIILQLGNESRFTSQIRLRDAVGWFEAHQSELDADARQLWQHARLRCRTQMIQAGEPALFLS